MERSDTSHAPRKRIRIVGDLRGLWIVLVVLGIYTASIGPAYWLRSGGFLGDGFWLDDLYWPVWKSARLLGVGRWLYWWIQLV